jgi:hypothetical protein
MPTHTLTYTHARQTPKHDVATTQLTANSMAGSPVTTIFAPPVTRPCAGPSGERASRRVTSLNRVWISASNRRSSASCSARCSFALTKPRTVSLSPTLLAPSSPVQQVRPPAKE